MSFLQNPKVKAFASQIALVLGIGTFLAILGPFGSHAFGAIIVWLYWTGLMAWGFILGNGSAHIVTHFFPKLQERWVYMLVMGFVTLVMSFTVWGVNTALGSTTPFQYFPLLIVLVLVITCFVTLVFFVYEKINNKDLSLDEAPAALLQGLPQILREKLPPRLHEAELWAMTSEDHYLRIFTDKGEAMILMRLSDAINACAAIEGAQTHRSWWVARSAMDHVERKGGRAELHLKGDVIAPVSRTYYTKLKDLNWF